MPPCTSRPGSESGWMLRKVKSPWFITTSPCRLQLDQVPQCGGHTFHELVVAEGVRRDGQREPVQGQVVKRQPESVLPLLWWNRRVRLELQCFTMPCDPVLDDVR